MAKKVKESINLNNINLSELSCSQLQDLLDYINSSREKGKKFMQILFNSVNMGISALTNRICVIDMERNISSGENTNLGVVATMVASLVMLAFFGIKAYKAASAEEEYELILSDDNIKQIFTNYGLEWDKLTKTEKKQFHLLVTQELYDRITSDEPKVKSL